MTARVLKGSKQEIAEQVANLEGDVLEAIVFVEPLPSESAEPGLAASEDIFQEMAPLMVSVGNVDYSRDAIYSRRPDE